MSVRGIGWYASAFVALIVSGVLIGVAAASFFASLTPLYVSIVCSVAAVALGVVAAVRARPSDEALEDGAAPVVAEVAPDEAEESAQAEVPTSADGPADADEPAAAAPAEAAQPGDGE
jgi:hypothetical protein